MSIDGAKIKFEEFKTNFEVLKQIDISESDTRSKLLDFLFKEVLGWNESQIQREGHSDAGYFDYRFSIPGFHFICEAKKNFEVFALPNKHRYVTLGTLFKQNTSIIKQIRGYLSEEGITYGILTNGHQFIVSKFINIDGTDWRKNKAAIFFDIDDIDDRFIDFYNMISYSSVVENNSFNIQDDEEYKSRTIFSTISNPTKELVRNSLSINLTPLLDSVFGEIFSSESNSDMELVHECFVSNEEIRKNRSEIEQLFSDLPPKLEEVIPAINTSSIMQQIEERILLDDISIKNQAPPNPIIIIGSKGAGKTTFINYLFNYALNDSVRSSHPVIYIDIRRYTPIDLSHNHSKIYQDLIEILYDRYPEFGLHSRKVLIRIYIKEIKRNDEGIWAHLKRDSDEYQIILSEYLQTKTTDYESHFIKLNEYLIRERRIRIVSVFDNADQLNIPSQQEAFLFSQSISSKSKCGVILALREGYYYRWRNKPPFDAYYSHVYHITAPPYGEILQKRIDFALKEVTKTGKVRGKTDFLSGADLEVSKQAIVDFLNSAKSTLFGKINSEMLDFLSQTTYPNIREGLRLFRRFLISGHTQVEQYVVRQNLTPQATIPIPIHEFVKAIALDNKLIYNSETSIVHNIFKPVLGSTNHFTKYKILKYLTNYSRVSSAGEKFILITKVLEVFGQEGYKRTVLMKELLELLSYGLVESQEHITDTDEIVLNMDMDSIGVTLKGHYYVCDLVNRFHYLELVAQDTPIFDPVSFSELIAAYVEPDLKGYRRLDKRVEFVKLFYAYLVESEHRETSNGDNVIKDVMKSIKNGGLSRDVSKIKKIMSSSN